MRATRRARNRPAAVAARARGILLPLAIASLALSGCAGSSAPVPADPIAPPPGSGAWRPGEAMALMLKPPPAGVRPIDDDYLERTAHYRFRIEAIEAQASEFESFEKIDRGGRRIWFFDGPNAVFMQIDVENDGTVDQTQYFGPEGLFAVVHRFAEGRRTQRIYWPPGESRIVEIRDNLPPYPGVWWRTHESPFRNSNPAEESDT